MYFDLRQARQLVENLSYFFRTLLILYHCTRAVTLGTKRKHTWMNHRPKSSTDYRYEDIFTTQTQNCLSATTSHVDSGQPRSSSCLVSLFSMQSANIRTYAQQIWYTLSIWWLRSLLLKPEFCSWKKSKSGRIELMWDGGRVSSPAWSSALNSQRISSACKVYSQSPKANPCMTREPPDRAFEKDYPSSWQNEANCLQTR